MDVNGEKRWRKNIENGPHVGYRIPTIMKPVSGILQDGGPLSRR